MQTSITFDQEFDILYNKYANDPIRAELLNIEGISRDKLDIGKMSHAYFTKRLSDVSVDQNANANEDISPNNYSAEIVKGPLKLEGYYLLWRYANKRYGIRHANKLLRAVWDGDLYFHDPTAIQQPYCYSFSTTPLIAEGRPYGQLKSLPPKRSDSFIAQVVEVTMDLSQEFCGAVAPADMLVNYAWYAKKEGLSDDRIINDIQKFTHVANNKFRVSGQSLKYEENILINGKWVQIGDFVEHFGDTQLIDGDFYAVSFDQHTGRVRSNRIYGVSKHKRNNPIVEVELVTGQKIKVTTDHSLFTLAEDGNIKVATPSDEPANIIVPINFATSDSTVVNISEYQDVLKSTDKNTRLYDEIALDDNMMYLLGYYLGNGTCDGSALELSTHNEIIEAAIVDMFPMFKPRVYNSKVILNVGKQFCAWVKDTFGSTSHTKRVPPEYGLMNTSLYLAAGYIDADGTTDGSSIKVSSVSEGLINDIQFLLQAHGLLSTTFTSVKNDNNYLNKEFTMYNMYISNDYAAYIPTIFKQVNKKDNFNSSPKYDLTNIKKICQKLFKQSKYNWEANIVRYEVIDRLIEDVKEMLSLNISGMSVEHLREAAEILGLPKVIANKKTGRELYGWDVAYNLNRGNPVGLKVFIQVAERRQQEALDLLRKLYSMKNVLPIKVRSITELPDQDEYVYDISVEEDENFLSSNGIFAHNSPFTNISLFDRPNIAKVWDGYRYPDGSELDIEFIMHIQKLFGSWFSKGDPATGLPYRFPVCSVNMSVDDEGNIVDKDFLDWVSDVNIEKGIFNIYVNDGTKIASCCRLSNNFERMKYRVDTFGGGGLNIGSHRVITVNLPRIALMSDGDERSFFSMLEYRLEQAKKLLIVHREELLRRRVAQGFLKFFSPLKWFKMDHLFSTIGIVGIYEMCQFMGKDILEEEGVEFVTKVLKFIEDSAEKFSSETGKSFNVEEIPAESTAVALAKKDWLKFGDDQPYKLYSNQYIPLIAEAEMLARIKLTGKFMNILSGGGILHLNVSEQIQTPEQMRKLIEVATKNGVEHFAINYGFGICRQGHTSVSGNADTCLICGDKIEDYLTRVIGYFTKVSSWNSVRREFEFPRRIFRTLDN